MAVMTGSQDTDHPFKACLYLPRLPAQRSCLSALAGKGIARSCLPKLTTRIEANSLAPKQFASLERSPLLAALILPFKSSAQHHMGCRQAITG